jgi:hypothetical protein
MRIFFLWTRDPVTYQKVQNEDIWCQELINHVYKAESMDQFPNTVTATRLNLVERMRDVQKYRAQGHFFTLEVMWAQIRSAFIEVNSVWQ